MRGDEVYTTTGFVPKYGQKLTTLGRNLSCWWQGGGGGGVTVVAKDEKGRDRNKAFQIKQE